VETHAERERYGKAKPMPPCLSLAKTMASRSHEKKCLDDGDTVCFAIKIVEALYLGVSINSMS
jgi:hypothetical protein